MRLSAPAPMGVTTRSGSRNRPWPMVLRVPGFLRYLGAALTPGENRRAFDQFGHAGGDAGALV